MEVWAGGATRIAHITNEFATLNLLSFLHKAFVEVGISSLVAKAVVYDNLLAISLAAQAFLRVRHNSIAGGIDGVATTTTKVNAFCSGLGRFKKIVLYDNLVNNYSTDEIAAVFAHELGHYKHRDTMKLTVIRVIAVLLIVVGVGLYAWGVLVNGEDLAENLPRTLIICLSGVSALMKTFPKRRPLDQYPAAYQKELGSAFQDDAKKREALLSAVRLYNEDKNAQAMRVLNDLQPYCRERDDHYAVGVFTALCQTDMGLFQAAVETYEGMILRGAVSSQLYSNMGSCLSRLDEFDKAADALKKAIELDPQNPLAHNNLANLYFRHDEYDQAQACAEEALRINPATYQAASLLASTTGV